MDSWMETKAVSQSIQIFRSVLSPFTYSLHYASMFSFVPAFTWDSIELYLPAYNVNKYLKLYIPIIFSSFTHTSQQPHSFRFCHLISTHLSPT